MNNTQLLVASSALTGVTIVFIFVIRHRDQLSRDNNRATYQLDLPPNLPLDHVTAFTRSMTGLRAPSGSLLGRDSVVFETVRRDGTTQHRLRVPRHEADQVLAQLRAVAPGIRTTLLEDAALPTMDVVQELGLSDSTWPLRTDNAQHFATSLLGGLGLVDAQEVISYQLVAYPLGALTTLPIHQPARLTIGLVWLPAPPKVANGAATADRQAAARAQEKLKEPMFGVVLRVGACSASRRRSCQLVNQTIGTLHQLDRPGVTFTRRFLVRQQAVRRLHRAATPITAAPMWINGRELATLMAWSVGAAAIPGLALRGGRLFPPSAELPAIGRVYGRSVYLGMERPVAVAEPDTRMHTLLLGPTGTGKSTLMLNLILQDLAAGKAIVLVDPNVGLAEAIIARLPRERTDDLIYLNPADELAVPLNPLACAPEDAELVGDQVLAVIRDRSLSWGVTIDELLRNTLVLLAASPGMTLTEVPAVLRDDQFRASLLATLSPSLGPTVGEFFAGFAARSRAQQIQDTAAVLNKVSPLLDRRPIRALLGEAEPTWTMRQVIDEGRVLIVALPSGLIGSFAADVIGALVVRMVWNAVLASIARQRPLSLYLDEVARFIGPSTDLADILARGRGFDLDVVAALQHLVQAPPKLQAAFLSELRNKVLIQPAADDARRLASYLSGVTADDLAQLAPHTALAALVANGRVTRPVTLVLPPAPPESGHGPTARVATRRFGRSRAAVEKAIAERRRTGRIRAPRGVRRLP
jgi:hypothetical protein